MKATKQKPNIQTRQRYEIYIDKDGERVVRILKEVPVYKPQCDYQPYYIAY